MCRFGCGVGTRPIYRDEVSESDVWFTDEEGSGVELLSVPNGAYKKLRSPLHSLCLNLAIMRLHKKIY